MLTRWWCCRSGCGAVCCSGIEGHAYRNRSGSLATFAAIRRALAVVSKRRPLLSFGNSIGIGSSLETPTQYLERDCRGLIIQANRLFVAATMTRYAAEFYSADEINKLSRLNKISATISATLKPGQRAQNCPLPGNGLVQCEAAKRWDGATCQACAPLSYRDVSNSAKGPLLASADNRAKWLRAFIWQIFFRKECARMDSRARSSDGTAHPVAV